MTKQRFLAIIYLLIGIILPAMAQTFTEQKKTYPVSADGSKYVVSGFTSFSRQAMSISTPTHYCGRWRTSVRSYVKE